MRHVCAVGKTAGAGSSRQALREEVSVMQQLVSVFSFLKDIQDGLGLMLEPVA